MLGVGCGGWVRGTAPPPQPFNLVLPPLQLPLHPVPVSLDVPGSPQLGSTEEPPALLPPGCCAPPAEVGTGASAPPACTVPISIALSRLGVSPRPW